MEAGTLERPKTAEQNGAGLDEQPPVDDLKIAGTQMSFPSMGGKAPTSSTFKITGGKIDLENTSFKKGEVVTVQLTCVVNNVQQVDKHDPQTGIVVSAEQRHQARVTDIRIVDA